jgi:hypothetical protein
MLTRVSSSGESLCRRRSAGPYDPGVSLFLPGRDLAAAFYAEVVADLVGGELHAAALLGWGSDVLGYDTARSTDHGWGPRLQVFVDAAAVDRVRPAVDAGLPSTFRGWPVRFGWDEVAVRHGVEVTTLDHWLTERLGFVPAPPTPIPTHDWLVTPQQALLGVTAGAVFHDGPGHLSTVRSALAWYPDQVWLWLLACQWQRVAQEEAFVGRTAEVGDDLGSRLVAARLARDVVRLCFLLERRYAPYSKWLGTAFAQLDAAAEVGPPLAAVLAAADHAGREQGLAAAYEAVARRFNALALSDPVDPTTRPYHGRPFRVLHADRFAAACQARLTDPDLRELPLIGAVDQALDTTDILSHPTRSRHYQGVLGMGGVGVG